MKYRQKPVEKPVEKLIDAVKYQFGMEDGFVVNDIYYDKSGPVPKAMGRIPAINTPTGGFFEISPGDYIITNHNGRKYLCKPDVFELLYEPTKDDGTPVNDADIGADLFRKCEEKFLDSVGDLPIAAVEEFEKRMVEWLFVDGMEPLIKSGFLTKVSVYELSKALAVVLEKQNNERK